MYNTEEKKYNQTNKLTGATTTPVFDTQLGQNFTDIKLH